MRVLLWIGLVISLLAGLCAFYSGFWTLQAVMCHTHLERTFWDLLKPSRLWASYPKFYRLWLELHARLRGAVSLGVLSAWLTHSWWAHLSGEFVLTGLWLTVPATTIVFWNLAGDASLIAKTRLAPSELAIIREARTELEASWPLVPPKKGTPDR